MAKRIRNIGTTHKKIKSIGTTNTKIDSAFLKERLGAEKVGIEIETGQPPLSLLALQQSIFRKLKSCGGRPSLSGTQKDRTKIPLFTDDWLKLKTLSSLVKERTGTNVSPAQIASVFIHESLEKLEI